MADRLVSVDANYVFPPPLESRLTAKTNTAKNAAVTEAKTYTDTVVDTSHLAADTDGTPYFSPGSMTLRVFTDTDGNPFFLDA